MKIKHEGDYRARRAQAYPDVTEQLDMLWHAMDRGESDRIEPFYSSIKGIKLKFPKSK